MQRARHTDGSGRHTWEARKAWQRVKRRRMPRVTAAGEKQGAGAGDRAKAGARENGGQGRRGLAKKRLIRRYLEKTRGSKHLEASGLCSGASSDQAGLPDSRKWLRFQ